MSVVLKPHNEEAYENVVEMHEKENKVAVVHPTGTGKSFIGIKLIEDNQDGEVLYLAPYNSILHQLKENIMANNDGKMFGNVKRMTYAKLSRLLEEEFQKLKPKVIVLDEFHHCGSQVWGEAVRRLINANPQAKVLGLSATPIRYFDGNIDMAEELFEGKIASEMSFEDALQRGILPKFDYVSALYGCEESLDFLQKKIIEKQGKVSPAKTQEALELYSTLKKSLEANKEDVQNVFSKHMKNKNGKYMVFCRSIEDMEKRVAEAQKLFSKVNPNIKIYKVSSSPDDIRNNEKTLNEFENDHSEDSLKIMFSINMLSEGYHLPDIDGIIMMRPTQSPTVYQQQMGRALTIGNSNKKRPVIIDLVDNFESIRIIEDFNEKMKKYKGRPTREKQEDEEKDVDKVRIFDYVKDTNRIIRKIEKLSRQKSLTFEEKVELFNKYYEDPTTDGDIKADTVYEGYPIGEYLAVMRSAINTGNGQEYTEEQIALLRDNRLFR